VIITSTPAIFEPSDVFLTSLGIDNDYSTADEHRVNRTIMESRVSAMFVNISTSGSKTVTLKQG
jgi:hypothetical protein